VPVWFLALFMAAGLYWQLTASVSQIARSVDDPSTSSAFFEPAAHWLRAHGAEGLRVEVPPTANHWESAYLAPKFELARGWLRQLDTTRDDVFYDEGGLTDATYSAWLRGNAISYVALPNAPLDYSSVAERRLILSHPSYLTPTFHSQHWRIYRVLDPKPLVAPLGAARAQTLWVGRQGFALNVTAPGEFLVDLPRRRLHPAPRRLDRRPRLPSRRPPGRRRLLARPRLERGHGRPQDLLRRRR
jgi:hypothetical protein